MSESVEKQISTSDGATDFKTTEISTYEEKVIVKSKKDMDVTLQFMLENESKYPDFTPEQDRKLFRKLCFKVVLIVCVINLLLFMDKNAIGYSKLLGMWSDLHITAKQYSNINSIYYAGYLIGQIPGHLLFQRIGIKNFMTGAILLWTILMFVQLAARNYGDVAAIRFFLGLTESAVTPAIEHTLAMYFTLEEQAYINPIFWISAVGVGIPTGFLSYGVNHYKGSLHPWKLYWIINGALTAILSIWIFLDYPTNPIDYKAFTIEERVQIIRRIKKKSRSSVEDKTFKKDQLIETLTDPISYLFALFAFCSMLANNMNFQQQIIYTALGVSKINTNLVTVAQAGYSTVVFTIGTLIMTKWKDSLAYLSVIYYIPSIIGGILAVSLSWSNKIGILAGCIIVHSDGFGYICGLCWSQSSAAGYTKKIVRTTMFMIAYGIANIVAPQLWVTGGNRYYNAWIVQIVLAWFLSSLILLAIRFILAKRNNERKANLKFDNDGNVISSTVNYIDNDEEEGERKVDISMLDLTDIENKEFIYPL
ncbi:hypothetical protein C6P42_003828 [Pichia californica]|nr:hypothetical protein C6P42_003828 [[Candida] californica]